MITVDTLEISNVHVGAEPVSAVYWGVHKVWPGGYGEVAAELSGAGVLSATAIPSAAAEASLSGHGVLSAVDFARERVPALLVGAGELSGLAFSEFSVPADLTGDGALSATAFPRKLVSAQLDGQGQLSASALALDTSLSPQFGTEGSLSVIIESTVINPEGETRIIILENDTVYDKQVPDYLVACYVTLIGGGASGGNGTNNAFASGGGGGGGGGRIDRVSIDPSLLGTTYSLVTGNGGGWRNILAASGVAGLASTFTSGGIALSAGGGEGGGGAATGIVPGGAGGTCSATGIAVTSYTGGPGCASNPSTPAGASAQATFNNQGSGGGSGWSRNTPATKGGSSLYVAGGELEQITVLSAGLGNGGAGAAGATENYTLWTPETDDISSGGLYGGGGGGGCSTGLFGRPSAGSLGAQGYAKLELERFVPADVAEPVSLENTSVVNAPVPNCSGMYVTLIGAGGAGGTALSIYSPYWCYPGGGGGGGGRITRVWIPIDQLGPTYTITRGVGVAGAAGGDSSFTSGSVTLVARGGAKGGNGGQNTNGTAGPGGSYTISGITATGYNGAQGGTGYTGASGSPGTASANAGAGGGGGGIIGHDDTSGDSYCAGAAGGNSTASIPVVNGGATAPAGSAAQGNPGGNQHPQLGGGAGGGGGASGGGAGRAGGRGGNYGGGSGGGSGSRGAVAASTPGGDGYTLVEYTPIVPVKQPITFVGSGQLILSEFVASTHIARPQFNGVGQLDAAILQGARGDFTAEGTLDVHIEIVQRFGINVTFSAEGALGAGAMTAAHAPQLTAYTTATTYTVPDWCDAYDGIALGGGGGGEGGGVGYTAGCGGERGAWAERTILRGRDIAMTNRTGTTAIGGGGSSGGAGGQGGTSTVTPTGVGSLAVSATGGVGGQARKSYSQGNAGHGATALNWVNEFGATVSIPGSNDTGTVGSNSNGSAANAPGGGGGGGGGGLVTNLGNGAAGAAGRCWVNCYQTQPRPTILIPTTTYAQSSVYEENVGATWATMNNFNADGAKGGTGTEDGDQWIMADTNRYGTITHIVLGYDYLHTLDGGWGPEHTEGCAVYGCNDGGVDWPTSWTPITTTPTLASTGVQNGLVGIPINAAYRWILISSPGYLCLTEFEVWRS